MSSVQRCFCQLTALISPVILQLPVYTACTCWAESSCLFTCGCRSVKNFTSATLNIWRIASRSAAFSGTLSTWSGFLCSRYFICSEPMNNPPDISQDPKEYEEYAHGIQKHVRGYLMVGALLLTFTVITVALSRGCCEHVRVITRPLRY